MRLSTFNAAVLAAACCAATLAFAPAAQAAPVIPAVLAAAATGQHAGAVQHSAQDPAADVVPVVADSLYTLGQDAGFAGQEVDTDRRSITVFWKGSAPQNVRTYIASRPLGVTIALKEGARASRTENMAAAQRLMSSPAATQLGIQSIAVNSDGSGITVRVPGTVPPAAQRSTAAAVPDTGISFEKGAAFIPAATRANDAPAWKGGARTLQGNSACSTAFAVLVGSAGRLLSAHHCDTTANKRVTDGKGQTIASGGASVSGKSGIDSQLIDPSASPATKARVYTGAWNSSTTAVVKNWASNWKGQRVCPSGATSGQHCGTIINDATVLPWTSGNFYIEAQAAGRGVMVAGGDSGGPVFATVSGGVQARGVILAGSDTVTCGAHNPDVNPPCYNNIVYAPISVVLNSWNVRLEVG